VRGQGTPAFLPHVTRRDSARQLVWGMLIDLPCATPVPEISGTSPQAQPFISPPVSRRARELGATDQAPFRSRVVMAGHEMPGRGLSTVRSRLSGIARYDIPSATRPSSSLIAAASVSVTKRSSSAPCRCFSKTEATVGAGSGLFSRAAAHSARQPQRTRRPAILLFGIRLSFSFPRGKSGQAHSGHFYPWRGRLAALMY